MRKIMMCFLCFLLFGCSTATIQKGTYKNKTEDYISEVWLMIQDENQFRLSPSPVSSYHVFGKYEIIENKLILTDSENENIYHFVIMDDKTLQFEHEKSTQLTLELEAELLLEFSE